MNRKIMKTPGWMTALIVMMLLISPAASLAFIDGITGPTFNLTAGTTHIVTPDANSILVWGYANSSGASGPQYPGPTLIVNEGDDVTVNLTNNLDEPVSIVFPGQKVTATPGTGIPGLVTREAQAKVGAVPGTVSYTFTATNPGTYLYHSGSHQDLQVEMGLFGALIVRPAGFSSLTPQAYGHADTAYDREFLFLLSEMDPAIHEQVEFGRKSKIDTTSIHLVNWFINGRAAPDTMAAANAPWLPSQPYNCSPIMRPGEQVLLRLIGGNKDLHPFHTHGNNFRLIAKDGVLLESNPGVSGPDLAVSNFTQRVVPGETYDALFTWTGQGLNWDIYGPAAGDPTKGIPAHTCDTPAGFDTVTREYCPDHDKPFPVTLPDVKELTNGPFWSGSPFLGVQGSLPPGQGTGNLEGGFFYMWHSHNERELTNNDIFPGGLLTMLMIDPNAPPTDSP